MKLTNKATQSPNSQFYIMLNETLISCGFLIRLTFRVTQKFPSFAAIRSAILKYVVFLLEILLHSVFSQTTIV